MYKRMRKFLGMIVGAVALAGAGLASAEPLAEPAGKPILVVSGKIENTNKDGAAHFDRAMLESLGMVAFETSTPWYKGLVRFEGVPLAKLLDTVGAKGDRLLAAALNDYTTELPVEDARKFNVIVALKRDGEYMPVRDKGPLFIVYPYDSNPELKSQQFYSRSAWQLARLEVK